MSRLAGFTTTVAMAALICGWAQGAGAATPASIPKAAVTDGSSRDGKAWERYVPGKYDAADSVVIDKLQREMATVTATGGHVDLAKVISGELTNKVNPSVSWNPYENNFTIMPENMREQAHAYVDTNPLFTDPARARMAGYADVPAFPLLFTNECMPALPKRDGLGDYFVVTSHNDVATYYKPFYAGDRLFTVYTSKAATDITPPQGSRFRTFALGGSCKVYNQRGELVAEGANILKESVRRHSDPAARNPDHAQAWESPNWWTRPKYVYTDADWQKIIAAWKAERPRGSTPLYWDDVRSGQRLGPAYSPPLLNDVETDMMFKLPTFAIDIKRDVLDPAVRPTMVKNERGIYVRPGDAQKKEAEKPFSGAGRDTDDASRTAMATPEIAERDGRATMQNSLLPKFVAGMVINWMGDAGWMQRIGWDIMWNTPGYSKAEIPDIPQRLFPPLFDKFPVAAKVPLLAARSAGTSWHALEGDIIVMHAVVTDKYVKDGEYLADLVWWCTTFDNYLVERGFVTVRLPKRPA